MISSDASLVGMKTSFSQRRALLTSQMANLTPNHPQYKQAAQELAQIDSSMEKMTSEMRGRAAARIQQRLRNDLARTAEMETES